MLTVPPRATVGAANDLAIMGKAATVTVAVFDVAPAPDSVASSLFSCAANAIARGPTVTAAAPSASLVCSR